MQQETVTLIVAGLGIGGTLAGIVVGHFLTRSWQREQWLLDCRKQEFKEVASAISHFSIEHLSYVTSQGTVLAQSKQAYVDSMKAVSCVLTDRIFIASDLDSARIPSRFLAIMEKFIDAGEKFDDPADQMSDLMKEVVELAKKDSK
ncbi:MAG TPA: hypothetical protein VGT08_05090 [Terracidiphilus sp.]|nr:hypothetical protein [Terracidiphilus sp.]